MNEFPEPATWNKILNIISKNPGINLNNIAESLNMNILHVEQYLASMIDKGEITVSIDGDNQRYRIRKSTFGSRDDRRTQETRKELYELISKNPGLHLSKIAETFNMSRQLAEYHLLYMEKNNLIRGLKKDGGYYKRFYIADSEVGVREKQILALLREKILLKIVLQLWKKPNLIHKDLLKNLDIAPSTLTYHLNKLVESNIVEVFSYGQKKGYSLKNEKEIIWIVRKYKLDRVYDYFKDMWKDLNL